MSIENDTDKEELIEEAVRMIELAREKIIPLFPPDYKVLIMARNPRATSDQEKVFLTNEEPADLNEIIRDIRKFLVAAHGLDSVAEAEEDGYIHLHRNDGTIN